MYTNVHAHKMITQIRFAFAKVLILRQYVGVEIIKLLLVRYCSVV